MMSIGGSVFLCFFLEYKHKTVLQALLLPPTLAQIMYIDFPDNESLDLLKRLPFYRVFPIKPLPFLPYLMVSVKVTSFSVNLFPIL